MRFLFSVVVSIGFPPQMHSSIFHGSSLNCSRSQFTVFVANANCDEYIVIHPAHLKKYCGRPSLIIIIINIIISIIFILTVEQEETNRLVNNNTPQAVIRQRKIQNVIAKRDTKRIDRANITEKNYVPLHLNFSLFVVVLWLVFSSSFPSPSILFSVV